MERLLVLQHEAQEGERAEEEVGLPFSHVSDLTPQRRVERGVWRAGGPRPISDKTTGPEIYLPTPTDYLNGA